MLCAGNTISLLPKVSENLNIKFRYFVVKGCLRRYRTIIQEMGRRKNVLMMLPLHQSRGTHQGAGRESLIIGFYIDMGLGMSSMHAYLKLMHSEDVAKATRGECICERREMPYFEQKHLQNLVERMTYA